MQAESKRVTYTCQIHQEEILAAALDKGEFICAECLEQPDIQEDRLGFFQDFMGDNYDIVSILGESNKGTVFRVVNRFDNRPYSVKVYQSFLVKDDKERELLVKEVKLHAQMRHKNILKYKHAF